MHAADVVETLPTVQLDDKVVGCVTAEDLLRGARADRARSGSARTTRWSGRAFRAFTDDTVHPADDATRALAPHTAVPCARPLGRRDREKSA
ncbi:hypothetical protein DB35_13220 [Streptomyces abyssalis]|nr:hypothetical protein DB35_13220 [Streptomyces abyssalis]